MSRLLVLLLMAHSALLAAGSPELLVAIRNGDHSRAQKLLRAGAGVNTVDSDGTTALMHAVIESDVKMMKLLMDHGANVNAKNSADSTALMYAAATDFAKTQLLLNAGSNVKVKGKRGATPMNVAVMAARSSPILKLLATRGAEPEDRLMLLAAQNGDYDAIQFLLGLGIPAFVTENRTQVLQHRERRDEGRVLVDRADAELECRARCVDADNLPVDPDLAGIRSEHPREDADQGRLACAVLTEQAMHLAVSRRERDVVVRHDSGEPLRDAEQLDGRGACRGGRFATERFRTKPLCRARRPPKRPPCTVPGRVSDAATSS